MAFLVSYLRATWFVEYGWMSTERERNDAAHCRLVFSALLLRQRSASLLLLSFSIFVARISSRVGTTIRTCFSIVRLFVLLWCYGYFLHPKSHQTHWNGSYSLTWKIYFFWSNWACQFSSFLEWTQTLSVNARPERNEWVIESIKMFIIIMRTLVHVRTLIIGLKVEPSLLLRSWSLKGQEQRGWLWNWVD